MIAGDGIPQHWWRNAVALWAALPAITVVGIQWRGSRENVCDWDGLPLDATYKVRVLDTQDSQHEFCCVQCAIFWLGEQQGNSFRIFVTDESSCEELLATKAYYVRSTAITNEVNGNRYHVFKKESDAIRHAASARGQVLEVTSFPFRKWVVSDFAD